MTVALWIVLFFFFCSIEAPGVVIGVMVFLAPFAVALSMSGEDDKFVFYMIGKIMMKIFKIKRIEE